MTSIIAKIKHAIFGAPPNTKVAIIGLDSVGKVDLLERLSNTPIEQITDKTGGKIHTGTNYTLKFDFVVVEVGGGAKAEYHRWMAQQYCDASAFIWVVDSTDTDRLMESKQEMRVCRNGRRLKLGLIQPAVSTGAPWLLLVNFKQNSLVRLNPPVVGAFSY